MLDNLEILLKKLEDFDPKEELIAIVAGKTDTLTELQKDQWMEGMGVDGEFIRPYYSENPYFKTADSAAAYGRWKKKLTPNPQRPDDVPNLYINGFLHSSMHAEIIGDMFDMESDASFATDVFSVHKNAKGLNEEKRLLFAESVTLPMFSKVLQSKTGLVL